MKRLLNPSTSAIVLLLVLLTNLKHAVMEYEALTGATPASRWITIPSLIAIDLAVFLFALHGKSRHSAGFAIGICWIHLTHFIELPVWCDWITAMVFAAMFAFGVYTFSEIFAAAAQKMAADEAKSLAPDVFPPEWVRELVRTTYPAEADLLIRKLERFDDFKQAKQRLYWLREKAKKNTIGSDAAELDILEKL